MDTLRRKRIDYAVFAIVLIIAAVLLWPSLDITGESDPAPDDTSALEETPTPEPTAPPMPTPTPMGVSQLLCTPTDGARVLSSFVEHFNAGDVETVASMLPEGVADAVELDLSAGIDQHALHGFHQHEHGPSNDHDATIAYLQERMDAGETWALKEFNVQGLYHDRTWQNPEVDRISAVFERESSDVKPHFMEGELVVNCVDDLILMWDFATDDPELAVPISVDEFIDLLGPYPPAQRRSLRMIVTVDQRPDAGLLESWDLQRQEATAFSGGFVEDITVSNREGEAIINYTHNGEDWMLDERGWKTFGRIGSGPSLPFEVRLPRREPSVTGQALQDHLDDIPDEGEHEATWDLEQHRDILESLADFTGLDVAEGDLIIELDDGAVVASRYELRDAGGEDIFAFEIRWIAMQRHEGYPLTMFEVQPMASARSPRFDVPAGLRSIMELASEERQVDEHTELYGLFLENVTVPLLVMVGPSRGGLAPDAIGNDWDPDWETHRVEYSHGEIVWVDREDAGFPTQALWDTGSYRFEMRIPSQLPYYAAWDETQLRIIAEELSLTSPQAEE